MASNWRGVYVACIIVVLMMKWVSVRGISSREFDSMVETLRARGYDLFCNAIVTSDLQFELFSYQRRQQQHATNNTSFTFFAPTDASLFALDMTQTASSYTDTLRFHVVPRRLSLSQLRLLPDGYTLPTLLPNTRLQLTRRPHAAVIAVGGVDIAFPALFNGRDLAVHGLAGILSLRSNVVPEVASNPPSPAPLLSPTRSPHRRHFSPRSSPNSRENQTVLAPVPKFASFNITRWRGSPPPVNGIVHAPEPEPADSPVVSPPDSAISLPPVGYFDAPAPAPVGLDLRVGKKDSVWWMESLTVRESKSEALDGMGKCEGSEDNIRHMQCHAA